jgi:hypothetical protein
VGIGGPVAVTRSLDGLDRCQANRGSGPGAPFNSSVRGGRRGLKTFARPAGCRPAQVHPPVTSREVAQSLATHAMPPPSRAHS